MNTKESITREIDRLFDELEDYTVGSEEYSARMDAIIELHKMMTTLEKADREAEDKADQIKQDRANQRAKNVIDIAGIVLPIAVTIWGTITSLKFEETGTVTTIMGRGFINKLLKK